MKSAASKTFPAWFDIFKDGLEDCSLDGEARRSILEVEPLEDYYFAGVVALEAARIGKLFPASESARLLSEIADQVDRVGGRPDRLASTIVFELIGYLTADNPGRQAMAYDDVVLHLLRRLRIDAQPATRHLMTTTLFRHRLGEPLALGVPHWWVKFHNTFALKPENEPSEMGAAARPRRPALQVASRRPF